MRRHTSHFRDCLSIEKPLVQKPYSPAITQMPSPPIFSTQEMLQLPHISDSTDMLNI